MDWWFVFVLPVMLALVSGLIANRSRRWTFRGAAYWEDRLIIVCVSLGFIALIASAIRGVDAATVVDKASERPALASAVANLSRASNEDVLGQAVEFNRVVLKQRRWNTVPVIQWLTSDDWDSIELIEIPSQK